MEPSTHPLLHDGARQRNAAAFKVATINAFGLAGIDAGRLDDGGRS